MRGDDGDGVSEWNARHPWAEPPYCAEWDTPLEEALGEASRTGRGSSPCRDRAAVMSSW